MHIGPPPARRVMVIYGTRPEAIKLAPVIRAIHASPLLSPIVTLTGQHRAIVDQVNTVFGIRPDHDLNVIQPAAVPGRPDVTNPAAAHADPAAGTARRRHRAR